MPEMKEPLLTIEKPIILYCEGGIGENRVFAVRRTILPMGTDWQKLCEPDGVVINDIRVCVKTREQIIAELEKSDQYSKSLTARIVVISDDTDVFDPNPLIQATLAARKNGGAHIRLMDADNQVKLDHESFARTLSGDTSDIEENPTKSYMLDRNGRLTNDGERAEWLEAYAASGLVCVLSRSTMQSSVIKQLRAHLGWRVRGSEQ